jgi:hypothetical protein
LVKQNLFFPFSNPILKIMFPYSSNRILDPYGTVLTQFAKNLYFFLYSKSSMI